MTNVPLPAPTWGRFTSALPAASAGRARIDCYRIDSVRSVRGAPLAGLEAGAALVRLESEAGPPEGAGELLGVTQHLGYQTAAERIELSAPAPPATGALCVLIPLTKSAAWWALAHDERNAAFRSEAPRGHVRVGTPYANLIYRKLYHARYVPGSTWDFITYFEFPPELADDFRSLVSGLRDPDRNPEWNYVERESEIWMRRLDQRVASPDWG